ncbi:hypothetical protein [Kitasatospora sp. NBC_00458]|uniref:hypothetical protein n=1 Tax=Kitasatospora sp. NBC_00458 TaxID=2903568 RepID=UPI002E17BB5F
MNLDFDAEPLFSWYVVLLAVSGIAMVVLGALNLGGVKIGWRILNVVAGIAFAGYAYYLGFVFEGGEYRIFFQAFILPVVLIANSVKALTARASAPAPQPLPAVAPYGPGAPYDPNAPQQQAAAYGAPYQPAPQAHNPQQAAPYQQGAYPQAPQQAAYPQAPQQPAPPYQQAAPYGAPYAAPAQPGAAPAAPVQPQAPYQG